MSWGDELYRSDGNAATLRERGGEKKREGKSEKSSGVEQQQQSKREKRWRERERGKDETKVIEILEYYF